jgi:hypothetical protein
MAESVQVELPRKGFGEDLARTLEAAGFHAEVVEDDDHCELHVSYGADEHERLLGEVANTIESWLGDQMMPLVVERVDGRCITLRPPAE